MRKHRRKIIAGAAATLIAAGTALAPSAGASTEPAAYDPCADTRHVWSWGGENFVCSHPELAIGVENCDWKADGHHAVLLAKSSPNGAVRDYHHYRGAGTCSPMAGAETIYLKSCVGEGDRIYNCTTTWVRFG